MNEFMRCTICHKHAHSSAALREVLEHAESSGLGHGHIYIQAHSDPETREALLSRFGLTFPSAP